MLILCYIVSLVTIVECFPVFPVYICVGIFTSASPCEATLTVCRDSMVLLQNLTFFVAIFNKLLFLMNAPRASCWVTLFCTSHFLCSFIGCFHFHSQRHKMSANMLGKRAIFFLLPNFQVLHILSGWIPAISALSAHTGKRWNPTGMAGVQISNFVSSVKLEVPVPCVCFCLNAFWWFRQQRKVAS